MLESLVSGGDYLTERIVFCVAVFTAAAVGSWLLQMPIRKLLSASDQRKVGGSIFQNIVRFLVWGWAICICLDVCLDIDIAGIVAALGVAGIAVSLGAQQTIANLIGGIIVSVSKLVGPGDWILLQGHKEACVIDTNWRRTMLEDENGVQFAVPNAWLVSNVVEKGNPFFMIVIPFAVKQDTPDIENFLAECEQVLLDRMVKCGLDYEAKRPKAHVEGTTLGAILCEVKLYPNRSQDSRAVKRAVLPALIDYLQEHDALADIQVRETQ